MKTISLYTGAGGLDLGLEAAGFETGVAIENDCIAVKTLEENRAWPVLPRDIHSVRSEEILAKAGLDVGEATLLVGGPPCQPFSKSGFWARGDVRRLGDPRASTIEEFLRVLADTKPVAYILENVPGLGYRDKDEGLRLLRERIEAINRESQRNGSLKVSYSFDLAILDSYSVGVPQRRSRLFLVGHREGLRFDFFDGAGTDVGSRGPGPFRTAWDAIGQWEDDDDPALRLTGKWADLLPSIPEGENYLYLTAEGGGEAVFGWRRRYWSFLLKLAKHLPSWTLTAQPGPATGPFHWKNRRLSGRELSALQTFPRSYKILGSLREVQRQLGNTVPPALAEYLGLQIRRQLLGDTTAPIANRKLVPRHKRKVPNPEPATPVPAPYRHLIGSQTPHPGTGLGPGASRR